MRDAAPPLMPVPTGFRQRVLEIDDVRARLDMLESVLAGLDWAASLGADAVEEPAERCDIVARLLGVRTG